MCEAGAVTLGFVNLTKPVTDARSRTTPGRSFSPCPAYTGARTCPSLLHTCVQHTLHYTGAAEGEGERLESGLRAARPVVRDLGEMDSCRNGFVTFFLCPSCFLHARVLRSRPPAISRLLSRRWSSGLALFAPCSHNRVNALTLNMNVNV